MTSISPLSNTQPNYSVASDKRASNVHFSGVFYCPQIGLDEAAHVRKVRRQFPKATILERNNFPSYGVMVACEDFEDSDIKPLLGDAFTRVADFDSDTIDRFNAITTQVEREEPFLKTEDDSLFRRGMSLVVTRFLISLGVDPVGNEMPDANEALFNGFNSKLPLLRQLTEEGEINWMRLDHKTTPKWVRESYGKQPESIIQGVYGDSIYTIISSLESGKMHHTLYMTIPGQTLPSMTIPIKEGQLGELQAIKLAIALS
jgi:hypothetical protein